MTPLLREALACLGRGWSVLPIAGNEKKASVPWKRYQTERASESTIRRWFTHSDATGLAVIFGAVSGGLASRDFDQAPAYFQWAERYAELAMILPTVKTARGYHVYFRAAEEQFATYDDGEYRGDRGHYSILPPSLHPLGMRYSWKIELPAGEIAAVDPVEVGLLQEQGACNRENRDNGGNRENRVMASVGSVLSVVSVPSVPSVAWDADLESTLPAAEGQRDSLLWPFARALKARPQYADADAAELEALVREWHRRALPKIGTKSFDETRFAFTRAWNRVKFPLGTSPIEAMMKLANQMNPPPEAERYDSSEMRRLATLCALLQSNAGKGVFFLGCRTAAQVLGVTDHVAAWRWLSLLKADGLLVMTEKGKSGRASRWRWTGTPTEPTL